MRKRRSGCIVKRGSVYYLRTSVNGKIKSISLQTGRFDEAERKAATFAPIFEADSKEKIALYVAEARKISEARSLLVGEAWQKYEDYPKADPPTPGTFANYKRQWQAFVTWLMAKHQGTVRVGQIDQGIATEYAAVLREKGISNSTFNYHLTACRLVCRMLAESHYMDENPFECIKLLKTSAAQKRKDFTSEEVQRILASFDGDKLKIMHKADMRTLFYVLAYTGLRLADAALLKWKQVDIRTKLIACYPAKTLRRTGRAVSIPIAEPLEQELAEAAKRKDKSGYVTPSVALRYLKQSDGVKKDAIYVLEETDDKFKERNGIKGGSIDRRFYGVHSFRHFFASRMASQGVPMLALKEMLGDDFRTLEKYYLHTDNSLRSKVLAALPSASEQRSEEDQLRNQISNLLGNANSKILSVILLELQKDMNSLMN